MIIHDRGGTLKKCVRGEGGLPSTITLLRKWGCRNTPPSHLASRQHEVQNPPKVLLALDAERLSIMYVEIVLLLSHRVITTLERGRVKLATLSLIFLQKCIFSISLEGEGTYLPHLTFLDFEFSRKNPIDTQLKDATKI